MSAQATAWAWSVTTGSPTRKAVLVALANRHNPDTGLCFPAIPRIAVELEMSERTVQRALRDLEDHGFITTVERFRENGAQSSNAYALAFQEPVDNSVGGVTHSHRGGEPVSPGGDTVSPLELKENYVRAKALTELVEKAEARYVEKRPRDQVWDALTAIFGPAPTGKISRGAWNAACKSLRADGCDGSNLETIAAAFRKTWPGIELTPTGLAKHYPMLAFSHSEHQRHREAVCPVCDLGGGYHAADCAYAVKVPTGGSG